MTNAEQQSIKQLNETLAQIRLENQEFKNQIKDLVEKLQTKVDNKHIPISLEAQIVNSVKDSLSESIVRSLEGYNSPLQGIVTTVIQEHSIEIKSIFEKMVKKEIDTAEFSKDLESQFRKKLAQSVISGVDGIVDKEFNNLKQNPVFRSELTLLINDLITRFNNQ